jgi:DnaJ-class molecular chaperone
MSHEHPTSSDQRVDQKKYARGYLRLWGKKCPVCNGVGMVTGLKNPGPCAYCDGVGYVEK